MVVVNPACAICSSEREVIPAWKAFSHECFLKEFVLIHFKSSVPWYTLGLTHLLQAVCNPEGKITLGHWLMWESGFLPGRGARGETFLSHKCQSTGTVGPVCTAELTPVPASAPSLRDLEFVSPGIQCGEVYS